MSTGCFSVRACKEITCSMNFKKQRPNPPFFFEKEQVISLLRLSLAVKDIHVSKEFYEKLGFKAYAGEIEHNWIIMQNEDYTNIGLFQGMFEKNILTFNPGWNNKAEDVNPFIDIRTLQEDFRMKGIKLISEVNAETEGPASFVLEDPDGNTILFDQHR